MTGPLMLSTLRGGARFVAWFWSRNLLALWTTTVAMMLLWVTCVTGGWRPIPIAAACLWTLVAIAGHIRWNHG